MIKTKYKVIAFGLSSLLMAGSSQAETVSAALKNCGLVQNSLKRLVCYDKIVNEMNRYGDLDQLMSIPAPLTANKSQVPAVRSKTPTVPVNNKPSQPVASDADFGMEQQRLKEQNTEDKIYATVVNIQKNARKKRVFTLSNDHVWRETEGVSLQIKEGQTIYIERGALGSFHLSRDDVNRRIRVTRVK